MGNVKTFSLILLLIVAAGISDSLAQDSLWSASYGGYYNENGYAATRLSNGDFLLVGSTFSYGSGDYDIYLIKIDSTGGIVSVEMSQASASVSVTVPSAWMVVPVVIP